MRTDTLNDIPGQGEQVYGQLSHIAPDRPTPYPLRPTPYSLPPTTYPLPPSTLIMGIGNYLMADEGVGVHLAQRLSEIELPPGVDVLDGGTGGFHLLEYFEQYPRVILIDATLDGRPAGTIRRIKPRFASEFPQAMSTHDIGLKDLVGALQLLDRMPEIVLFVVSIDSIQQQGVELTSKMKSIFIELTESVIESLVVG